MAKNCIDCKKLKKTNIGERCNTCKLKYNLKEMIKEGKAPGCIGYKTGGKWG